MPRLPVLVVLLATVTSTTALEVDGATLFIGPDKMPAIIREQVTCQTEDDPQGTRRPFVGGFVFTARCPGNHANSVQALVFAPKVDGTGARLLLFPRPKGEPADSLSNVRWDAKRREVSELFVNPEETICRSEGRWRLGGEKTEPRLVFWRETRDCQGKRGWRILLDRRTR